MTHIGKSRIVTLLAACGLTTVAQAATTIYTTDTILTTTVTKVVNDAPTGFQVTSGATLTLNSGGFLEQLDQASFQTIIVLGTTDGLSSGNLVMNAGSFITGSETGGNNLLGIAAYGSSIATINGGVITVTENGNGPSGSANTDPLNAVLFRAFGSSQFILNGGNFNITETTNGQITPFTVGDSATVEINGGTWGFTGGPVLGFNLSGTSQVKLNGTFAGWGLGNIDDATDTGTITGTLANGDAFNMNFDKTAGGTITIIPEPRAALLGGLGLLALLRRRRM